MVHSYLCDLLVDVACVEVRLLHVAPRRVDGLRPLSAVPEVGLTVPKAQRLLLGQRAVRLSALCSNSTSVVQPRLGRRIAGQVIDVILVVKHEDYN